MKRKGDTRERGREYKYTKSKSVCVYLLRIKITIR